MKYNTELIPQLNKNVESMLNHRQSYNYPAVALKLFEIKTFNSTKGLDNYINRLLHSQVIEDRLIGYLSVLFWGFYSGQDGIVRQNRALGKVKLAILGTNKKSMVNVGSLGVEKVANIIETGIDEIENDSYSTALEKLTQLPQIGLAFASKICAFIDPEKCGVIDSVIATNYPQFEFKMRNNVVTNTNCNRSLYQDYCLFLQKTADDLNKTKNKWKDRDETEHEWRAVDVERSIY